MATILGWYHLPVTLPANLNEKPQPLHPPISSELFPVAISSVICASKTPVSTYSSDSIPLILQFPSVVTSCVSLINKHSKVFTTADGVLRTLNLWIHPDHHEESASGYVFFIF